MFVCNSLFKFVKDWHEENSDRLLRCVNEIYEVHRWLTSFGRHFIFSRMSASAEWRHISSNVPGKARQDEMESCPVDSSRSTGTKRSDFGKSDEGWTEQRLWNYLHVALVETFDKICTNVCVDREIIDCALSYSRFQYLNLFFFLLLERFLTISLSLFLSPFNWDLDNEVKYYCIYYNKYNKILLYIL